MLRHKNWRILKQLSEIMAAKEGGEAIQHKDNDEGGLAPVEEEDAVMGCLSPPNCCYYF